MGPPETSVPEWFKQGSVVFIHERNGFGRVADEGGEVFAFRFRSFRRSIAGFLHPVFSGKRHSRLSRRPRLGDRLIFSVTHDRHGPCVAFWTFRNDYLAVAERMRAPKQLALV